LTDSGPNHKARDHAIWSASSTDRWCICAHSVDDPNTHLPLHPHPFWADPGEEDQGNFHTARGTCIHEEADAVLTHYKKTGKVHVEQKTLRFVNPSNNSEHTLAPDEWHPHVLNFVNGVTELYEGEVMLWGEADVELMNEVRINVFGGDIWGSTDAAIVSPSRIHVIDLKCGHSIVDPSSGQNKTYACGIYNVAAMKHKYILEIELHIAQHDHPQHWSRYVATPRELKAHYDKIRQRPTLSRCAKANNELPTAKCINAYCNWCPKFTRCPAHHNRALAALELADKKEAVPKLHTDKLKKLVELGPLLSDLIKAATKELTERTKAGDDTGYKVVAGRSNRKWNPELSEEEIVSQIEALAQMNEKEVNPWEKRLISFTDIEKQMGKGSVDALVIKPEGKPTLVPKTDGRKPLDNLEVLNDG